MNDVEVKENLIEGKRSFSQTSLRLFISPTLLSNHVK